MSTLALVATYPLLNAPAGETQGMEELIGLLDKFRAEADHCTRSARTALDRQTRAVRTPRRTAPRNGAGDRDDHRGANEAEWSGE